jgi:CubicO group peptidase (beta-lactamase class C family)
VRRWLAGVAAAVAVLAVAPAAQAARHCAAPGETWGRATPSQAGLDGAKLAAAVREAAAAGSTAVRVYRYGCLVAEDAANPEHGSLGAQSFSMAKSIGSLIFGRAWTLGLIGPDDPVGALFPEADRTHGALLMRHLLTMTSGTRQTVAHDYNLLLSDRVRDALTLPFAAKPGTTFEYWQSGPPLLDAATGRAAGEDVQDFAQRALFSRIGIVPGSWTWTRDRAGNTMGFWGLVMRPDDFARFGELLRRGGVWGGHRLLSARYVHDALEPIRPFGCYAWLIWRPATARCNWPTFLGLPADMWQFNGANGQLVTVFPTQGVMTVRTGAQVAGNGWAPSAGSAAGATERTFYDHVLGAVTDAPVRTPHRAADPARPTALAQQRFALGGADPTGGTVPALPTAGPRRARAVQLGDGSVRADRRGRFAVTVHCPPVSGACRGSVTASDGRARVAFSVPRGATRRVRVTLDAGARRRLARRGRLTVTVRAVARDATSTGTRTAGTLVVRRASR